MLYNTLMNWANIMGKASRKTALMMLPLEKSFLSTVAKLFCHLVSSCGTIIILFFFFKVKLEGVK